MCPIMVGMTWSSAVLPLAGVALGSLGALLGQYLASRADTRRYEMERSTNQRTERKEAIVGFLSATERMEHYSGQVTAHGGQAEDSVTDLMHNVWLTKKIIELVCTGRLAQAAHDFSQELQRIANEQLAGGKVNVSGRAALRRSFMEAARREMGYTGEPLRRYPTPSDQSPSHPDPPLEHQVGSSPSGKS